jgi:hydroxyethylthiazole kinase-like uncharacterized protein yjeF
VHKIYANRAKNVRNENKMGVDMTELLTAAQMRAIEAAAIASGAVTGLELMERAGRRVVEAIFEEWPDLRATSHRAVVLCGPGNNGGDGFVVARLLRGWGWEVEVFFYGCAERLPPDAKANYQRWCAVGDVLKFEGQIDTRDAKLVVDALFGTGLSRSLSPEASETFQSIISGKHAKQKFCAIDMPSGLCADSGRWLSDKAGSALQFRADMTVTFAAAKLGHVLAEGADATGSLQICDIGLATWHDHGLREICDAKGAAFCPRPSLVTAVCPDASELAKGSITKTQHKYSHGHALVLSGAAGAGGAARLAARGALRIGAGVVTVGCPLDATGENAAQLNAIMLAPVADAGALAKVLADKRINALCLGPGMGVDRAVEMLGVALRGAGLQPRATVLDADALTALARTHELFELLHKGCVLTPHAGEFARLFPDIAAKLSTQAIKGPAYSKVDACREAAKRAGCVVLFKGADTVIADAEGRCSINSAQYDRAAPWLATAGAGDVLAGFITGLLARGFAPMRAAGTAAWLHVESARSFGPGLIAEDLPEAIPKVFRDLGI